MELHYPTRSERATPEYVLAVLRDFHRQQCQCDPAADDSAELTFQSTVAEWRDACDLVRWRELGRAENKIWQIDGSNDEWRAVLEPAGEKTLADVCRFIAERANRPVIRPAQLLGNECLPAGAFLTIRSLLHQAGEQEKITPSTPLEPFTIRHGGAFLVAAAKLVPGALPLVRIRTPGYDMGVGFLIVGLPCIIVGFCCNYYFLMNAGVALFAIGWLATTIAAQSLPESVEFGELRTFRDLAMVIAKGAETQSL